MRRLLACCLILGCCWSARPGWADEPAPSIDTAPRPADRESRGGPRPADYDRRGEQDGPLSGVEGEPSIESQLEPHIAELLKALDTADEQLAEAQQQLETAKTRTARRQLHVTIRNLQTTQADLLRELEETLLGPRPPIVRDDPPTILEEQFDADQRHHEAILESDVQLRLPSE